MIGPGDNGLHAALRLHQAQLAAIAAVAVIGLTGLANPAAAQRIENKVAVFAALDKVTARIQQLEVPLNETVEFGALKITPRVCYSRPETERPKTTTFVEITQSELDGSEKSLFSGWMFAESPGLNAVEHPVFDLWLTECKGGASVRTARDQDGQNDAGAEQGEAPPPLYAPPRRRVRR